MKRLALVLAMLASPVLAQDSGDGVNIPLFSGRDLTETAYAFCATFGDSSTVAKEPWRRPDSRTRLVTSGSSTTVTALAGTPAPFTDVAAGDELRIVLPTGTVANTTNETIVKRFVTARASATSITVNAAVDLGTTGMGFQYRGQGALEET